MSLVAEDLDNEAQCLLYLQENTVTQDQANRCATTPSMAWETLYFMTGGDYVESNRCGAVTFAAVVNQGTEVPTCEDGSSYNSVGDDDSVDVGLCTAQRQCSDQILSDLVSAVDMGKPELPPFDTWTPPGSNQVTTTTCQTGWEADDNTAGYFCSHVPYTDDAGYPLDETGTRLARTDVDSAIGTWVGGLQCKKRACPDACGSALGDPFITGDSSLSAPRDPPEGLTDTCCSGVFGEPCTYRCKRGYKPAQDGNGQDVPLTCTVTGADTQAAPEWSGATCDPKQCYTKVLANTDVLAEADGWASGNVGDSVSLQDKCDTSMMMVGTLTCGPSQLFQGGRCNLRPTSGLTADDLVVAADAAQASSNVGLARDAFDNDPLTYWYSTRNGITTPAAPDTLTIELGDSIVPLGLSIQLGKSTMWTSFKVEPKDFQLKGRLGTTTEWDNIVQVGSGVLVKVVDGMPNGETTIAEWNPPCNDETVDDISCTLPDSEIPCSTDDCLPGTEAECNYPGNPAPGSTWDGVCGPTEFDIPQGITGAYDQFRLEITAEWARERDPVTGDRLPATSATTRYGQIYIQDIHIMTAAPLTSRTGNVAFTPQQTTCCGDDGSCCDQNLQAADGAGGMVNCLLQHPAGGYDMSWDDCVEAVAQNPAFDYMQYSEALSAGGYRSCYGIPASAVEANSPQYVSPVGDAKGAICYSLSR